MTSQQYEAKDKTVSEKGQQNPPFSQLSKLEDECRGSNQSTEGPNKESSSNYVADVSPEELSEWLQESSVAQVADKSKCFVSAPENNREQTFAFFPVPGFDELDSNSGPCGPYEEMAHDVISRPASLNDQCPDFDKSTIRNAGGKRSDSYRSQSQHLSVSFSQQPLRVYELGPAEKLHGNYAPRKKRRKHEGRSTSAPPCMQPFSQSKPLVHEENIHHGEISHQDPSLRSPTSIRRRKVILHEMWDELQAPERNEDNHRDYETPEGTDDSSQNTPVRRFSFNGFARAMKKTQDSQQDLLDWDRLMGLKPSHSKTMSSSNKSRKQLMEAQEALRQDLSKDFSEEQAKDP